nr:hypothetical protein GCM10020093_011900 [Planobispora longispora]
MTADLIVRGRLTTLDPARPSAEALAVRDGRILAVGSAAEIDALRGRATRVLDTGDACVLPGFVEAHGHFIGDAVVQGGGIVDIRPVTVADAGRVVELIRATVAGRGAAGAFFNGWDPLLQRGCRSPARRGSTRWRRTPRW